MSEQMVHVDCYSGYKAGERPVQFRLKDRTWTIVTIEDRWYSPGATYFRVIVEDGDRYVLRHEEGSDIWTLTGYRAAATGTLADDPFRGRRPTSHERMTELPWDASYHHGPAPWDIGQPQPVIARLVSESGFTGAVLDVGCGTGENALLIASQGLSVLGVDVAETALAIAREKAKDRGIQVEFAAADALHLERLGSKFQTVLDCGLFHTFNRDERSEYVASLASVIAHGGTLYVLCFSDAGPDSGPHPVSQEELRAAFNPNAEPTGGSSTGWNIASIQPDRILTRFQERGAPAWLATIKRI
jgi:SAM-dependent methyltransferase